MQDIAVAAPGIRAFRWSCDGRYTGMKSFYAVGRVESGGSEYRSAGKTWRASAGTVVLKQPGDVHHDVSHAGAVTIQVVVLPTSAVAAAAGRLRVQPQLAANDERAAAFHRLHDAIAGTHERLAIDVAVTEAVAAFTALDTACTYPAAIRRAMELLRTRLAESVSLDELAAEVGLDKFHLCHTFRAQLGLPPYAYLTQLRIQRAKALLAAGVMPRDVAPRVGLYDQSQLNRHFRRIVGVTPGEYQRRA
ncbi:MAG TPA: AraC family transcriptional regulator [Kofleriaceae bacterium]|jgi:AraC-like DNA-binding protein